MSGTADTTFTLGDQYWCVHPRLPAPVLGTIIGLTDNPGKRIGFQYEADAEVLGGHTCDGRGEIGRCLWMKPQYMYNPTEWESVSQQLTAQKAVRQAAVGNSFKTITIDEDGNVDQSEKGGRPGLQKLAPAHPG